MSIVQKHSLVALIAGLLCVLGFAPFGFFVIPIMALAVLFGLWRRAENARAAGWVGFAFGFGMFMSGIAWIYVALHDYGAMPVPLAGGATALFAAFMALFCAFAGYAQARLGGRGWRRSVLLIPVVWVLAEWLRGTLFTGFPWLLLGYSQTDSPLAGYAPILGVYGVSLVLAASAGLLAVCWQGAGRQRYMALLAFVLLWSLGSVLKSIQWTQPAGHPFSVALIQGNVLQDIKFQEDALPQTLDVYQRLVSLSHARLTILPETALPLLRHEVPSLLLERWREHARQQGGDVLVGSFERERNLYFNSAFSVGMAPEQHYRKQHLVPFGEFIPLRPLLGWLINGVLDIPMGDLTRGGSVQAPLEIAGQRVAVNICYEDVFGEELIRSVPPATVLVNLTNDAWYGDSYAAEQHNQIARMRALEAGRMMLRATNTGVTSVIRADGSVQQQLVQHEAAVLQTQAQGYQGVTPYVRWGNAAVLILLAVLLVYVRLSRCERI